MTELISLYITALKHVDWQDIHTFNLTDKRPLQWLTEQGSLSRRLAEHCQALTVDLLENRRLSEECLSAQESALLNSEACLLREVVLKGDDSDWVVGRTLIPNSSIQDQPYDLSRQGEVPLGLTVFSAEDVSRDQLQVGWAETPHGQLLARRSRLWMNHKPMLVAELFLPDAPVYHREVV